MKIEEVLKMKIEEALKLADSIDPKRPLTCNEWAIRVLAREYRRKKRMAETDAIRKFY